MKRKNTLLKKIVILFLSLVFPLLIVWLGTIQFSNQTLKRQILSSIDSNNATFIAHLNNSLYTIYASAFTLAGQSNLQRFSNAYSGFTTYEEASQVRLLREQLSSVSLSLPFCSSAHIFFGDLGIMYNSKGYDEGSFSTLTSETFETLKNIAQESRTFSYYENPLTKTPVLGCCLMPSSSATYGVIFELSINDLQEYLKNNMSYNAENYLFTMEDEFALTSLSADQEKKLLQQIEASKDATGQPIMTIDGTRYYAFSYEMPYLSFQYTRLIPTDDILNATRVTPLLNMFFILLISAACIIFFVEIYRLVHRPLSHLINAFKEMETGNFKVQIANVHSPDFAYLYQEFNKMAQKLELLIEKDYTQKLLLQKAELKQLHAQINPHFLYNSFFMLQRMIQTENIEDAQSVANALGVYFRYLTRNNMDHVKLSEEYRHAQNYAYIQGLRFSGRIQIDFEELPAGYADIPVPKLILQPILENAFNYGLANKMKDGLLQVHFHPDNEVLQIDIEDNGEELTDEKLCNLSNALLEVQSTGTNVEMSGILNIQRRLIIFSNTHDSLHVSRSTLGGLRVSIILGKFRKGNIHDETINCR